LLFRCALFAISAHLVLQLEREREREVTGFTSLLSLLPMGYLMLMQIVTFSQAGVGPEVCVRERERERERQKRERRESVD